MGFINTENMTEEDITLVEELVEARADLGMGDETYDNIQKQAKIADVSTVRNSFNVNDDKDTVTSIIGALSGTSIKVSYYQRLKDSILAQTSKNDYPDTINPLDIDLVCIHDFDIRLNSAFNYEYDVDSNISNVTGTGMTYPKFKPTKGDMFLYPINETQIGIFKLTSITRLSISKNAVFSISFRLHKFAEGVDIDNFNKSVVKNLYFDKDVFLSNSNDMLETEEHKSFEEAKVLIKKLSKYYFREFYDKMYGTIMRYDGVYDVFLVEFLLQFLSVKDCGYIPKRYANIDDYDKTIWSIFSQDEDIDINDLKPWLYLEEHMYSPSDVNLNNLIEKIYLRTTKLCPYGYEDNRTSSVYSCTKHHKAASDEEIYTTCTSELYIFSQTFYESSGQLIIQDPCCHMVDETECVGNTPADPMLNPMDEMETFITHYLTNTVNYTDVVTYALTYKSFSDKQKFYYIPLLIFMLKEYVYKLTN